MGHHNHHHNHIGIAFYLNVTFTVVELIGGVLTGSMAILANGVHDLGDSLSLGIAWFMERYAQKSPSMQFSYGYKRLSLLSAMFTATVMVGGSLFLLIHIFERILNPTPSDAGGMLILSVIGIAVNGFAAYKVIDGGKTLNAKVISWHLLEDVLSWVAVFVASIALMFWDIPLLDPLLSLLFLGFVIYNVGFIIKDTISVFLQGVPKDVDVLELESDLNKIKNVVGIHDLHLWSLDGDDHVISLHVELGQDADRGVASEVKDQIREITRQYGNFHMTVEIEYGREDCFGCEASHEQ